MFHKILFFLFLLVISLAPVRGYSAKMENEITAEENGTEVEGEKPVHSAVTAILEGWCRDASVPLADSRNIIGLYYIDKEKQDGEIEKPGRVGTLYHDERGRDAVCVEETFVHPFVVTNVKGEMISISGWVYPGYAHLLKDSKVMMVDTMECLGGNPD